MPFPTPKVEIAMYSGPYRTDAEIAIDGAAQTPPNSGWVDVTSFVRGMDVDRGRSDDWGDFYSAATVTLDNRARTFDPFYTSGPYYQKLLPRRQIRITATYGATSYPVFRGYVNGWPPTWTDAGKDSTVTISCMDALGLLASETLPADWSRNYILSTSPRHYYPCDDPVGPYTANQTLTDLGSVPLNMVTTTAASNGDQLAVGLVNRSITGTGSDAANSAQGAVDTNPGSFSVSCWAIPDSSGTISQFLAGNVYNHGFYMSYENSTGKFRVEVTEPSFGNSKVATTTISGWDSGMARMLSFTWNASSRVIAFYIDGILIATSTANNAGIYIPFNELVFIGTGAVQQVIVWNGVQTQAVLQNIYKYSTVNLPETTAARFTRLIAETQFPASLTSGPSAPASSVLDITDDAPKLAGELQKVADSEYAPLFVDRSGVVTLYYQNQIRTQSRSIVSQGTYGAGGFSIGQNVAIAYDGDSMRNEANITMSGGGVYIDQNSTSITAYGAAQESLETQVSSLADAVDIGNIVTGWGGQVYPKADPFEVVLSPSADWSNALDRELNDRITLAIAPPTGNTITTPMLINRISHSVVPGEWRTTFEGSARWAAVFIVNQSLVGGTDLLG
jgi:hypothetical protein